ncbi:LPXTG cell wall anchor domain-containing protein [Companilactobacillus baiquanensis]|uniref:SpaA isopeptide-forming pilin-related protein n=1 Tax=Companilactobacillus baiquanensis TaxID=2486005 RepID=A0ABW1UUM6_9LACO|nr:LPXTG cell wall anchor domain-containing protein [Companilactobacillus baiquanensis]
MGKKLRTYLTIFVSALSMLILFFTFNTTKVAAANYNTGDLLSGFEISDGKASHATGDNVGVTFDWDATNKNLQNGDTWTIELPGTLKVRDPGTEFPLLDDSGNEIGKVTLNSDNTITVLFSNIEGKNDYTGSINIQTGIGVGKDAVVGDNTVTFPTITGDQDDNLNISVSTNNMTKKGTIGKDADGNAIITWQLLVNRNELNWNTINVHDHITDPNIEYVKGSVKVYKASWTSPGYYQKDSKLSTPKDYSINESDDGFDLSINNNGANQMYAILFTTKITDADKATDGTKFKNKATIDWTGSGNGEPGSDSASGSVTGGNNSGNGEGNIKGSVILQKNSASSENTPLQNAVYNLYNDKNEIVQSNLTTDQYGQINVTGLAAGNYYFKEVTPPSGYQQNNNEIHFSITGQTTEPIHVQAKDEPVGVKLGSLAIEKLDSETRDYLQGAEFDIIDENGKVVAHVATDENGSAYAYNLPVGTYTIHETKAPAGYIPGGDIKVTITEDNLTPEIISVENDLEAGGEGDYSVTLQKFDSENGTVGVPGAEYTLYDINGNELTTIATNEDGFLKVENMLPGTYYFVETKAPDGFNLNPQKIWFTINNDGTNLGTLVTSDDPIGSDKEDEDNNNTDEDNNDGDGIIVDPDDNDNDGNNNIDEGEDPLKPEPPYEGKDDDSATYLPQTGAQKGALISVIGLLILTSVIYFKRRKA